MIESTIESNKYKKGLLVAGIATLGVVGGANVVANADMVTTDQNATQVQDQSSDTTDNTENTDNYYDTLSKQSDNSYQNQDTQETVQAQSDVKSDATQDSDGKAQLDTSVENATNVLGKDNVEKTDDNVIKADTQEAGEVESNKDYQAQALSIDQTVTSYQNAVKALNNIDSSNLDASIAKVKELFGEDFLHLTVENKTVTVDSVQSDIAKINEIYKNESDAINVILDSYQKAVAKISQIDQSSLDSAVKNAQDVLGKDNVIQETDKTGTTDLENLANNIANVVADYKNQTESINKTVQAYQEAVKTLGGINSKDLDDAISKAKDTVGSENLVVTTENFDLGDITKANVSEFVDKMNSLVKEQVESINAQLDAYNKAYNEYQESLKANPNDTSLKAPDKPKITFKTFKYSYTIPQVKYHYDKLTMQKTPIKYTTYDVSVEKPKVQYHDNKIVLGDDDNQSNGSLNNNDSNLTSTAYQNNGSSANIIPTSSQNDINPTSSSNNINANKTSSSTSLPQMGDSENHVALLGMAMVAMSLGAGLLGMRRRFGIK